MSVCVLSNRFNKRVQDFLAACFLEVDGELVAVNDGDRAIAEFLVEYPFAERILALAANDAFGHQLAFDGERLAAGRRRLGARIGAALVALGALPAGRAVGGVERFRLFEARSAVGPVTAGAITAIGGRFGDFGVLFGQFVKEARGQG